MSEIVDDITELIEIWGVAKIVDVLRVVVCSVAISLVDDRVVDDLVIDSGLSVLYVVVSWVVDAAVGASVIIEVAVLWVDDTAVMNVGVDGKDGVDSGISVLNVVI